MKYTHYTIEPAHNSVELALYGDEDAVVVYGWGVYPRSSVLAGQQSKKYMDQYASVELALKDYPNAEVLDHIAEAGNTFDHLSDTPDYYH